MKKVISINNQTEISKSKYVIYADESGDHGLETIDKDYPVFVLSFCCFEISNYIHNAVPSLQEFKFQNFGHDQVILHEHHIRKQKDSFAFLRTDKHKRENFLNQISEVVANTEVDIFSVVIDKEKLKKKFIKTVNPYNVGLRIGLEKILDFLLKNGQENKEIHIIFERRGQKEDNALELEFRRICDEISNSEGVIYDFTKMKFVPIFADKKSNSCGLQLADLTARPIGIHYLRPNQNNKAFEIIRDKIVSLKSYPL